MAEVVFWTIAWCSRRDAELDNIFADKDCKSTESEEWSMNEMEKGRENGTTPIFLNCRRMRISIGVLVVTRQMPHSKRTFAHGKSALRMRKNEGYA